MKRSSGALATVAAAAGFIATGYVGLVSGAMPLDLNVGRRQRRLGPLSISIDAPSAVIMEVLAQPYLGRATRAEAEKIQVLARGTDLVLAAHSTPIRGRLRAVTTETVRFIGTERVEFRLVRGPVPHVVETFTLTPGASGVTLAYTGELGTDLWALGARWGDLVAARWEAVVAETFAAVKVESERRARTGIQGAQGGDGGRDPHVMT